MESWQWVSFRIALQSGRFRDVAEVCPTVHGVKSLRPGESSGENLHSTDTSEGFTEVSIIAQTSAPLEY